jgi:hypothetical protein
MPSCGRVPYRADRGWLIGLALLAAGELAAQTPERERMAQHAPAIEEDHSQSPKSGAGIPNAPPSLTRILQGEVDAAAEKARAAKSEQHEADDLAAQQKAANAAADAAAAAYWQQVAAWASAGVAAIATLVALFGTVFLIKTFQETRRTADAAVRSVDIARQSTEAAAEANRINRQAYIDDQRPWIVFDARMDGPITYGINGCTFSFEFTVRNVGRTPAMHTDVRYEIVYEWGDMDLARHQLSSPLRKSAVSRAAPSRR